MQFNHLDTACVTLIKTLMSIKYTVQHQNLSDMQSNTKCITNKITTSMKYFVWFSSINHYIFWYSIHDAIQDGFIYAWLTLLKNLSWNLLNVRCSEFVLLSINLNFKTWHVLLSNRLLFVSSCISHLVVPNLKGLFKGDIIKNVWKWMFVF